MKRGFKTVIN